MANYNASARPAQGPENAAETLAMAMLDAGQNQRAPAEWPRPARAKREEPPPPIDEVIEECIECARREALIRQLKRGGQVVYTRDAKVPLVADDWDFERCGWRPIPLPPTYGDDWVIVDDNDDEYTGWARSGWFLRPVGNA